MTARRNRPSTSHLYPTPTVVWHGPIRDGRDACYKVNVRHGNRVAIHERLTEEQYHALLAAPTLDRPGRVDYDGPARVARLLSDMGLA